MIVKKPICRRCCGDITSGDKRNRFCSLTCYHEWQKRYPNKGTFRTGGSVWNKGLQGIHLSPDTEFKKGNRPNNSVLVGTIKIRTGKNGTKRKFIKVAEPNQWLLNAEYVYQNNYGKRPKGMCLHHINENPLDDRIENLKLVTRAEHIEIHRRKLIVARTRIGRYVGSGYIRIAPTIAEQRLAQEQLFPPTPTETPKKQAETQSNFDY